MPLVFQIEKEGESHLFSRFKKEGEPHLFSQIEKDGESHLFFQIEKDGESHFFLIWKGRGIALVFQIEKDGELHLFSGGFGFFSKLRLLCCAQWQMAMFLVWICSN